MALTRLTVLNLRNIANATLDLSPQFNIIYGENGSGKTSILEAIYLLGLGRSFRSRNINSVIQLEKSTVTVFGLVNEQNNFEIPLGIERNKDGALIIRANEQTVNSIAELAHYLPVQVINQDSYQLLTGSPKLRRQFLDWGLFHVEQNFFPLWKRFQRCLQQRNAALRNKVSNAELKQWDKEYIETACEIDKLRQNQLEQYQVIFKSVLKHLSNIDNIHLNYRRGWHSEMSLEQALAESLHRDRQLGFTHDGPHRADMDIKIGKLLANQLLSRGQQKILTYSLLLAQGQLFTNRTRRPCIYLIDDMPAELDQTHIEKVLNYLATVQTQLLLTCIDKTMLTSLITSEVKLFHVKQNTQGNIDITCNV